MDNFRDELFEDPVEYEEVPLRDRKADFPNLQRRGGGQERQEKKAEFIRDVIALANTARLWGEPAHLLFGIDDSGKVVGIRDHLRVYCTSDKLEPHQVKEEARKQVQSLINEYIKPIIAQSDIKFGQKHGHLVAYLILAPLPTPDPFQVAKPFGKGIRKPLKEAERWIRIGESKDKIAPREISPTEEPYCYAYAQVPYLLPFHWERYFSAILNDRDVQDTHVISNYLEPATIDGECLVSVVQSFLDSDEQRLLLIRGAAGSGKTTFLARLVYKYASDGQESIEGIRKREEFMPPPDWIPVLVGLRHRDKNIKTVEEFTAYLMTVIGAKGKFWEERPKRPEKLLELNEVQWLLCLDGFDELEESGQKKFFAMISEFVRRYPRIKVLLTSRPDTIQVDWSGTVDAAMETIRPLTDREIQEFFRTYTGRHQSVPTASEDAALEDARKEALDFVGSHPDVRKPCSYPSYLAATIREFFPSSYDTPADLPESVPQNKSADLSVALDTALQSADESIFSPLVADDELRLEAPVTEELSDVEVPDEEDEEAGREIQTGIILNNVYRYLWDREVQRWSITTLDSSERWEETGHLALRTHNRIMFRLKEAQKTLNLLPKWLLTLGICQSTATMPINLKFVTELTKAFFAASLLASWAEGGEYESAEQTLRECAQEFRNQVWNLLASLTPHDFSRRFQEESEWQRYQNQI